MKQITAEEAIKMSKSVLPTEDAPPKYMIKLINQKIHMACRYGKFYTMLNSISDDGHAMPYGVNLSDEMIQSIENYYGKLGFKLGRLPNQIWIEWKEKETPHGH